MEISKNRKIVFWVKKNLQGSSSPILQWMVYTSIEPMNLIIISIML